MSTNTIIGNEIDNSDGFNDVAAFTVDGNVTLLGHLPGDLNGDGLVNIADLNCLVDYLFKDGTKPPCGQEGDVDDNHALNIADLTYLVDYILKGGTAPNPC